ncbi:MAG: cysteine--tRNA ligase, partial [Candidatus Bathyarchaeota archaeon]
SRAIASLFKLVRAANRALERGAKNRELNLYAENIRELGVILGLLQKSKKREELSKKAEELIKLREEARKEGNWEKADALREELKKIGVLIEDTPKGPRWRLKD